MAIESSTYSPHRAGERDFQRFAGVDLIERYPALRETDLRDAAEWLPVYYARSIPGGAVLREVYDSIKARIVAGLRDLVAEGPLDGLFLDIHGAMSVDDLQDAEGDLLTAIRAVIGPDTLISASMDLHGNVSEVLSAGIDIITCYRLAPHEDVWETRERAMRNLVNALRDGLRPRRAIVPVPILLPGEMTSTRVEPAKSLYGRIDEVEGREGIIDAAIWIGYAWADEPRCHGVVAVTGTDDAAIAAAAEELAQAFWDVRDEFEFVGPPGTLAEGVDAGLASATKPFFISDSGDNPGAGGTGDVTWTLAQLLADERLTTDDAPTVLVASIFDAGALAQLRTQTVGEAVTVIAGGRIDHGPHGPVTVSGILHSLHEGDPDAGAVAVIRVGGLHVIITEFRKAYHATSDFTMIGLDPMQAQIVVTKIGYLEPTLYDAQRGWVLALTPGGVDQDLKRLEHRNIRRPMFPYETFDEAPDLTARLFG